MTINPCSHILDSMPIGVIVTDMNGDIQSINRYAKSIMNLHDIPINNQNISSLLDNQNMSPVGNMFTAESFMETKGYKIIRNGRILEMVGAPLCAESDLLTGVVFTIKDITETERSRELEKKQERHAAIGELSAHIAHEIRNPLGGIELFASLLIKELKRKKDIHRVNQIIAAAKNVEDRISSLLLSNETCQIPVSYVNIHETLRDILLFSEQIIDQETIFLSARYADVEPVIECNPDIMKQVFLNLIMNALRAMADGGRLDIKTSYLPEFQSIEIHFIDHCVPISKNIRFSIFGHPSQTNGNPSGFGLAIVHNIVKMHKGSMRMEYSEGGGTAFILSFPVVSIEKPETGSCKKPTEEKTANA
ncbi:MAG: ATP-binding protein, partial [Deltaproteobacteria bacterium]|nr:ATP-binding protein [Deltaproteobacteria bacterium]